MFNEITLIGNIGKTPELRYTAQGTAVCDFFLATNERRKNNAGEVQDETTWFKIILWGDQAERSSQYLRKGDLLFVKGSIRPKEWQDKDGRNHITLEVSCKDLKFLTPHSIGGESQNESESEAPTSTPKQNLKTDSNNKINPKQPQVKGNLKQLTN